MAAVCLALGWMVTATLGPDDSVNNHNTDVYDMSSAGVLTDPSGFGSHTSDNGRAGIIGSDEDHEMSADDAGLTSKSKKPSVSTALADLHLAVTGKLKSWNPYFAKSSESDGAANGTTSDKNATASYLGGESVKDGIAEDERLGARIRIGKCTVLFSGNSFWERCIRTHEQHDKVHGYRLHVLRQLLMDDVWSKPAYVLSLLLREMSKPESERLDWLFWVDADTVILNPNIPIETFLPPPGTEFDDVHLMYSNDWNGLNNGVFPIRVNQWAVNLFSAIVSYRHFKPDDPLTFRDQSAMNSLMQEPEFAEHIVQAPQRWFNAYQGEHNETLQPFQVRRGDLLVHFAGVPAREERMQYWLERAEQHLDDWEVPVKSTSYPQEARDFWNEQKGLRKDKMAKVEETRKKVLKLMTNTDQRMNDYGDRLDDEQKGRITSARTELQKTFEQEQTMHNVDKLETAMNKLGEASTTLTTTVADAHRSLLQSAHVAIFGGEKDLLDGGFDKDVSNPELEQVSTTVTNLKALIIAPEEFWNRHDIENATNALTEARARLQESLEAKIAAEKQAEEEEAAEQAAQLGADKAGVVDDGASMDEGMMSTSPSSGETTTTTSAEKIQAVTTTAPGPIEWVTAAVAAPAGELSRPSDDSISN